MKTTEECPLRAVLFGKTTAQEACDAMQLNCNFNCNPDLTCCLFQFLDFLFFRCKKPEALMERLFRVIEKAPLREQH